MALAREVPLGTWSAPGFQGTETFDNHSSKPPICVGALESGGTPGFLTK